MIRYTVEETTTNTCPPCPPSSKQPCGCSGSGGSPAFDSEAFFGWVIVIAVGLFCLWYFGSPR